MAERQLKLSVAIKAGMFLLAVLLHCRIPYGLASDGAGLPFPTQFAKVIYQQNPDSEQQIYIVAQSHRSAVTGKNGPDTRQVQAEIYRIGEWLIENRGVAVLLPEGYFRKPSTSSSPVVPTGQKTLHGRNSILSEAELLARLAAKDRLVDANMLLSADFNVSLRQIEDRNLYTSVCRLLMELTDETAKDKDLPTLAAALNYQQKKRSAVLLRNIIAVLDKKEERGDPNPQNALFTVGLAHVQEIIHFLLNGKARVDPLPGIQDELSGYYCDLNPLKNYGITILLPRTLADNSNLLSLAMRHEDDGTTRTRR